jgi:type II secretory pathway pseudopilin PulG
MKKAFSISEILLVLIILGIIAALTVPPLMRKTNHAQIQTTLKKGFSTLANAYRQEFSAKRPPVSPDDTDIVMDAIKHNIGIRYYLICADESNCTMSYDATQAPAGSWAVGEDNVAYRVIPGGSNCANKLALNQLTSSTEATAATCVVVLIDADCIAKHNNPSFCAEIPDGTDNLNNAIKENRFSGTQMRAFVADKSIASGSPESTAAGIITSQE